MNPFFFMLFFCLGCGDPDSGDSNPHSAIHDGSEQSLAEFFTVDVDCVEVTDDGLYIEGLASSLWQVYGCGASGRCMPIVAEIMADPDDDSDSPRNTLWVSCAEGIESLQIRYLMP